MNFSIRALGPNGFEQGLVRTGQRMAAARFGVALEQRFLVRKEEQEGDVDADGFQLLDLARQLQL